MNQAMREAGKEYLRYLITNFIGTLATVIGIIASGINVSTGEFNIMWHIVLAVLAAETLIAAKNGLVKMLDKFLHESGKESGNESLEKGLTRF